MSNTRFRRPSSASSSRNEDDRNTNFNARRWIERGFVLMVGWMIAYCVSQTRQVHKIIGNPVGMEEEMDLPQVRSTVVSKPEERILRDSGAEMEQLRADPKSDAEKFKQQQQQQQIELADEKTSNIGGNNRPIADNSNQQHQIDLANEEKTSNTGGKPKQQEQKEDIADEKTSNLAEEDRLNIVLFYADDWTMNVLGKLNPNVHTPNIDEMADNGMLFLNNCVTTSICWQSRATLVTGTYYSLHRHAKPWSNGMFENLPWNQTLFPKLKSAGYYTGVFGKWHAPQPRDKMNEAFDKRQHYFGKHWMGDKHVTDLNREHAIEFLEKRPRDKSFALKVSFFATHAEDNNIPSYKPMNWSRMEIYPDNSTHKNYQTIVPPKTATDKHWKELPWFFTNQNTGRGRWRNRWEPHVWQKNIRDLFAMATEVDWAVGEIIKVLKDQGVYNNTLLIFTTDNGDLHGEHGLAEKWYPMEESIKVPLVIQDPRMPAKYHGTRNRDWTLNVDLAPTLLGAAGLEPASFMQGRDIADLYLANDTEVAQIDNARWKNNILRYDTNGAKKPWRTEWFYEWNMGDPINATGHAFDGFIDAAFALITNEWKYIYWPLKVYEQLFHRSVDIYDEYDILQNYYLHKHKIENNIWVQEEERYRMETFTPQNATPYGDSVESTREIYETMKAKYHALKAHVQSGGKI